MSLWNYHQQMSQKSQQSSATQHLNIDWVWWAFFRDFFSSVKCVFLIKTNKFLLKWCVNSKSVEICHAFSISVNGSFGFSKLMAFDFSRLIGNVFGRRKKTIRESSSSKEETSSLPSFFIVFKLPKKRSEEFVCRVDRNDAAPWL